MKIGIDISQIAFFGTGVDTYTRNLVKSIIAVDKKNDYVLFGSSFRRSDILKKFVSPIISKQVISKLYYYPPSFLSMLWNKLHILSIEKFTGNIDVFHTSDWLEPPAGCSKITTIHDLLIYKLPHFVDKNIINNQKMKLNWAIKESALIIADSQSTKKDIMEFLSIPESKIRVIYLGVDKRYFPQQKKAIDLVRKKYNIKNKYFLFIGNNPRKNLQRVIDAFTLINQNEFQLLIIGNNKLSKFNQQKIRQIEFIDEFDLPLLYSASQAFVYPSLYEGFGLPVLEAMASGTPVITSNKGSLAEVAGNIAYTINPESIDEIRFALKKMMEKSTIERENIIKQGVKYANTFDWENTAKQTLAAYQSLCK